MSKPTSYQLIKDMHKAINRVEDKVDKKMDGLEERINLNESKLDKIAGKIGIAVMFVTLAVTGIVGLCFDFIKNRFFK